jgi:hypothetical protein
MNMQPKSRVASFFLTFFLGPLGLLYSSIAGGLILLLLTVASITTVIGPLIFWAIAIIYGDHATCRHNEALARFEAMLASR